MSRSRYDREHEEITFPDSFAVKETGLALLVQLDDGQEVWFPKSQITAASEVWGEGDRGDLVVTQWICEQKGLA